MGTPRLLRVRVVFRHTLSVTSQLFMASRASKRSRLSSSGCVETA